MRTVEAILLFAGCVFVGTWLLVWFVTYAGNMILEDRARAEIYRIQRMEIERRLGRKF